MKALALIGVLLAGVPAFAQSSPPPAPPLECWPSNHIDRVAVEMTNGTTIRGSLLCLGPAYFTLAAKDAVVHRSLSEVRRIRGAADPVWDGFLKGALIALVPLAVCAVDHGCPRADFILSEVLGYGMAGLVIDAVTPTIETIYQPSAGRRAALKFRVPLGRSKGVRSLFHVIRAARTANSAKNGRGARRAPH
jgi:hypothetical protein